ncbi:MAG: alpha/beta fold hydrolase [Actinomycetes bacterium]
MTTPAEAPRSLLARPEAGATATESVRASLVRLAERFRPQDARGVDAAWVLEIAEQQPYTVHVRDGRCLISPGAADAPVARLRTDATTWVDIVDGRIDGIAAFAANRLTVSGDLNLALRLETMFTPGPEAARLLRTVHTTVKGVRLESLVAGAGTPVLLLHGLAANKLSFLPTLDGLSATGHEVHALDLAGFGKSEKPLPTGRRYTMGWQATLVHGYLARRGIREAYVVGNSMGGRVATELALRHPGSVRGIVGLGSAVAFDEYQRLNLVNKVAQWHWLGAAPLPARVRWIEALMADLFHDPTVLPPGHVRAGAEEVVQYLRDRGYRLAVAAAARHLAGERADTYWTRLASLSVPSLWIFGRQDRLVSHRYAARVKQALPHAQVEVWDRIGHVPQFEAPERTTTAIAEFTARIEAGL